MELFKKTITQELKNNNSSVTAMPTTSSTHEDFFDFDDNPTDQLTDYASKASLQILHFLEEIDKDWKILENYPEVKKIFFKYNTPLPSSTSVERLFSYAMITNSPKCNRLSDSNFQKRVILKANLNQLEK
ncbi:PREDICTED: uncharacterized protein LOC107194967 [Dufourea novaeangliae]|uniref:uncharacterized protein LOC107194967 n=1 Tax=Dufourea novaeangliae TaxID=178035 RepID=UPI00076750A8|nr:PREDICTED: uncharacterized protein LOC107194967 [Dufourea novaeangliae]